MVLRGQRGDGEDAEADLLDSIYRRYVGDVTAYALRRCSADDAADVVSETFVVAWRRIGDVPEEPAVRPWLFGIARRVLANQRRGRRRHGALVDRAASFLLPHLQTAPAVDIDGDADLVKRALHHLPADDRELLMMVAWEELTPSEIATVMGLSGSNVRKRLFRARKRLHAEVSRLEWERPTESGHLPPGEDDPDTTATEEVTSP
ncbi:MAG: RNA polymerase sigma factor [Actinomycetota bacterium]